MGDVYNSVSSITDPKVPAYLKSLVNGADAEKAYAAFLTFKDVVKKNQVSSAGAPSSAVSGDKIGEAAKKLSDASYPFLKDVDWTSDLFLKPLPGPRPLRPLRPLTRRSSWAAPWMGTSSRPQRRPTTRPSAASTPRA